MTKKILVLIGSFRKASFTRKVAMEFMKLAPPSLDMKVIEIEQLPLYNQDKEENIPIEWLAFRQSIRECDGILFATPEYNRSIPGGLKNAIDVGSRPYGKSVWDGKPAAIISVSPGAIGAFGANHHLRQSLVFLNMPCLQQPEAYIGNVSNLLDEEGQIKNPSTIEFLQKMMDSLANWINIFVKP